MFYIGLDIHSTRIAICALDEAGQVAHAKNSLACRTGRSSRKWRRWAVAVR
jgi:hypothetical protein